MPAMPPALKAGGVLVSDGFVTVEDLGIDGIEAAETVVIIMRVEIVGSTAVVELICFVMNPVDVGMEVIDVVMKVVIVTVEVSVVV